MNAKLNNLVIYNSKDGEISFNVNVFDETVWLTQKQMATLFSTTVQNIGQHIKSIYLERELHQSRTIKNFFIVQKEGNRLIKREIEHYNLDIIISVGYRVQSKRATQFRQWATKILRQHLLNGYTVNEPRIRQIEQSIDELVESNKLIKEDVAGIKNLLLKLIERPIEIRNYNNFTIGSIELEGKIIDILNRILSELDDKKIVQKISKVKAEITEPSKKYKANLKQFLQDLGDANSNTYKIIKGAGITKNVIVELSQLIRKLF